MSSPRVYWRGRIHPLGRIGGNKRLKSVPLYFAEQTGKIRSPPRPRDPRVAKSPDDYGGKASKPSKKKLCKRSQPSDSATELQATLDKRQKTAEFLHAVNKQAEGKPLSATLQAARDRDPRDPVVHKPHNEKADRARLNTRDGGDEIDVCTADHRL
ncbi:MAG: hypothetical protein ACK583_13525 [Cyanobacteriota bacterium]